jgi:BASS family bile acid:Na+ symporter
MFQHPIVLSANWLISVVQVGMQNSSLGVVLATSHFSSPLVVVPAAVSAVLMNIMGSALAVIWKNLSPLEEQA